MKSSLHWKIFSLADPMSDDVVADWTALAEESMEQNVFFFPWFVQASKQLFKNDYPDLVFFYEGDLLIGVLPVQEGRGFTRLPIFYLRPARHTHQFLATPLVRKEHEEQFVVGFCDWLENSESKYGFFLFKQMSGGTPLTQAIEYLCKKQKRQFFEVSRFERASINSVKLCTDLKKNKSTDLQNNHISSARSKSLRRKKNALAKLGEVQTEIFNDTLDFDQWVEDFLRLENMGWKQQQGTSIKSDPVEAEFYRVLMKSALQKGALKFFRLVVGGKAIAYTLDITSGSNAYCLKCAYDPEYRKYSPGVQMEYETLVHYQQNRIIKSVDSCTSSSNVMLNALWPDRKSIVSLAISRKGFPYMLLFAFVRLLNKGSTVYGKMKSKNFQRTKNNQPPTKQSSAAQS